jgi:transient receptor potential cation channel subfamily V protein 5
LIREVFFLNFKFKVNENIDKKRKLVCFDPKQRGINGETLLHLCFTNGSFIHMFIAQRLLKAFPFMINDICLSEDSYGQSALHMAIVNEDPFMVRYLLSIGADFNQRCVGIFFLPCDQQKKLTSIMSDTENLDLPMFTNYQGMSYFGEYPLLFAVILNQTDCVKLLIAHGANINKQDSNGNTGKNELNYASPMSCLFFDYFKRCIWLL